MMNFDDLPETAQRALLADKQATATDPTLQADLDALKVEAAERKAAQAPKIAKPVYATDKPASIAALTKYARAVKVLHGPTCTIQEVGGKFVFFTAGERCYCRACDTFLRGVAQFDWTLQPSIMHVCDRCGSKRCPQAANHEDVCNLEIKGKHEDWLMNGAL